MEQETKRLKELGYTATYIGKNSEEIDVIKDCGFTFLFSSPEHILANNEWRSMLRLSSYQDKQMLLVIDEAHTVLEW